MSLLIHQINWKVLFPSGLAPFYGQQYLEKVCIRFNLSLFWVPIPIQGIDLEGQIYSEMNPH